MSDRNTPDQGEVPADNEKLFWSLVFLASLAGLVASVWWATGSYAWALAALCGSSIAASLVATFAVVVGEQIGTFIGTFIVALQEKERSRTEHDPPRD